MTLSPLVLHAVLAALPLLPSGAVARLGSPPRGHVQGYHLSFSHDSKFLAEATHPPAVLVWNVQTGKLAHAFAVNQKHVGALQFAADGSVLVQLTASDGGYVCVFDPVAGKKVRQFQAPGGGPLTISPDGKRAAFWHSTYIKNDPVYHVSIWDVDTGKHVRDVAKPYLARHAVFSPDGKTLTLATYQQGVRVFDVETGKELTAYRGKPDDQHLVHWPVLAPDGKRALLWSNPARLVDLFREGHSEGIGQHAGSFRQVTFSLDGETLAVASHDGSIRLWNMREKKELPPLLDEHVYYAALAFAPNSRYLAAANGPRGPRVWDLRTGLMMPGFDGHLQRMGELVFAPDGDALASYSEQSARIFVWDVAGRKVRHVFGELRATFSHLRFSRNSEMLAACSGRQNTIIIWNTRTGKEDVRLPVHPKWIATFRFLPDEKTIVTAAADGVLRWFDLATGKETRRVEGFRVNANRTGGLIQHIEADTLTGPMHDYADFSPDGKRFASVTLEGGTWLYGNASAWLMNGKYVLRIWDAETGKVVATKELPGRAFPRYSFDGKILLVTGTLLQMLLSEDGKEIARNDKLPQSVRHMQPSPDHRWLLSSRSHASKGDVVAHVWSAKTGKSVPVPDAGQGLITATAISPNGKFLATGGADGTIVIWDAGKITAGMDDQ